MDWNVLDLYAAGGRWFQKALKITPEVRIASVHQEALQTRMQRMRWPSKLYRARGERKARMLLWSLRRSALHD